MGEKKRGRGTNTKRSQIAFAVTCIALSLSHFRSIMLVLPVSCAVANRDSAVLEPTPNAHILPLLSHALRLSA